MISKKTITFILVGIAIAAVPFFQRMQEQQRAGWYINQIEEDGNEESEKTGSYKKEVSPHLAEEAAGLSPGNEDCPAAGNFIALRMGRTPCGYNAASGRLRPEKPCRPLSADGMAVKRSRSISESR